MSHEMTKITINPQAQFIVSGGDKEILVNGEASCNAGCDLRIFLDTSGNCGHLGFNTKAIIQTGQTAEPDEAYTQDQNGSVETGEEEEYVEVLAEELKNG